MKATPTVRRDRLVLAAPRAVHRRRRWRRIEEITVAACQRRGWRRSPALLPARRCPGRDRTRRRTRGRAPDPRRVRGRGDLGPAGEVAAGPLRSAGNKDDRFDAFVLADALRTDAGRWAIVRPDSDETVALRMLVRARQDLIGHRIAVHNQLLAVLQHNFPGAIGPVQPARHPHQSGVPAPVPERSQSRVAVASCGWRTGSRRNSYCGRHTPSQLVDHLARPRRGRRTGRRRRGERGHRAHPGRCAGPPARPADAPSRPGSRKRSWRTPTARSSQSLPRAGTVRAATLLAEIGDCRARFPDPTALAAAAGVAPSTRQSGKHLHVAYRRGCNKQLRAALIDWAQDTPRANAWADDTYRRARQRGCRHPHAARILAQAWTRVLWRCWHDHLPYDPARHGRLNHLTTSTA